MKTFARHWMARYWMIAWFAVSVLTLGVNCARCQDGENEHLETDRDSFTPATTTAGSGRVIIESAYSFIDNRNSFDTHSFPELLVRYGIGERLEVRLGWNDEIGGAKNSISTGGAGNDEEGSGIEEESNLNYGIKFNVTEQDAWIPESAVILQGTTPTSGIVTDTDLVVTYVLGWEFDNGVLLDAALRYATVTEEFDHSSAWAPSVVVKKSIGEHWNAHVEYFGILSTDKTNESTAHYVSPGVHYLVTSNLELGVRVGWGLNEDSANFFSNAGVCWRY